VCVVFQGYIDCQAEVSQAYQDQEQWSRMSILNVARCGRFSSDHVIREYNVDIWRATSLPVEMSQA
jgi:starch phosphorylase